MQNIPLPFTTLCTVGTSLFFPNLVQLPKTEAYEGWLARQPEPDRQHLTAERVEALRHAYAAKEWDRAGKLIAELPPTVRLCGAELNSMADLVLHQYIQPGRVVLLNSDTDDGRAIATILTHALKVHGFTPETAQVDELRDDDPIIFRTHGLRNLVRRLGDSIRNFGRDTVAINATGGYKAQIAIAVLIGQSLAVPVYYKHERFSEIIAFPPMPVALDIDLWLKHADLFHVLNRQTRTTHPVRTADFDSVDERLESLLNRVEIDGGEYIELSATGQIFHETFRDRFSREKVKLLPPAVEKKKKKQPKWEDSGNMRSHPEILKLMQAMTDEVPYVGACSTHYYNPDLPETSRVRKSAKGLECVFSDGSWTVKWRIETTATAPNQTDAALADLNDWLESQLL